MTSTVLLVDVERRVVRHIDVLGSVLDQRNRNLLAADSQLVVVVDVLELELEGHIFPHAAIVRDVNLVHGIRIELEVMPEPKPFAKPMPSSMTAT